MLRLLNTTQRLLFSVAASGALLCSLACASDLPAVLSATLNSGFFKEAAVTAQ